MFLKSHKLVKNKKNGKLLCQYYSPIPLNILIFPFLFSMCFFFVLLLFVLFFVSGMVLSV